MLLAKVVEEVTVVLTEDGAAVIVEQLLQGLLRLKEARGVALDGIGIRIDIDETLRDGVVLEPGRAHRGRVVEAGHRVLLLALRVAVDAAELLEGDDCHRQHHDQHDPEAAQNPLPDGPLFHAHVP